jgi:hypothetical protein
MKMEQPRRSKNSVRAIFVVALFITGTVRLAGAQIGDTSFGTGALGNNTTGNDNSAFGSNALSSNTTGAGNTAEGSGALASNTFGSGNTADGGAALFNNTGIQNTAIGVEALFSNTSGNQNTAVGAYALASILPSPSLLFNTGNGNAAIGFSALRGNTTGNVNIAVGFDALLNNNTGSNNTAIGSEALWNNTTGSDNIAVGESAGSNLTTGDSNIDIGNPGFAGDSDVIRIGTAATRTVIAGLSIDIGNTSFPPGESNVIRIGTKDVQTRTFIAGISGTPVFVGAPVLVNANGKLGVQVSSDRFKRDIHDMGDASDRIMKLRPVTFRYKEDPAGTLQYGLVAEEVGRVYPELVTYGDDGKPQSVAYHLLPAMLINEMQKQVRENRRKDALILALRKQVESLEERVARIEARVSAPPQHVRAARPEI